MTFFLMLYSFGQAQSLVKMEYFLDKDPGVGKGDTVNFSGPRDTVLKTINIPIGGIKSGQHFVYVRVLDSGGLWSPWQMQLFFVEDTIDNGPVEQLEYFTGKDPGVAKATRQTITAGDTVTSEIRQATGGLKSGQNFMHVRAKMANGHWSPWQIQMFLVQDTSEVGKIAQLEYFLGQEPGPGKATAQPITAGDTVKSEISRSTASLSPGRHYVHVRAKLAYGYWSPWQFQMIYIQDTLKPGPVQQLEYFVNKDPGAGKGTQVSISSADTIQKTFGYNTAGLSRGQHYMHVRCRNRGGLWSPWQFHMFLVETPSDTGKIISYKYSIDSSLMRPARVKTTLVSPPSDSLKKTHLEKTDTALRFGRHFFRIWAQQNNRLSSTWHFDTFDVIDCPMLDTAAIIQAGRVCIGDTLIFRQDITKFGVWSRDSFNFNWRVNGTQLSTSDSLKYRHNTSDTFRLLFSFTRKRDSRCKGSLEQTIRLFRAPRDTFKNTICAGDSLLIHGTYRKTAGTYNLTGTSKNGCDSFSTVILKINSSYHDTIVRQICSGDSIRIHGTMRKLAGTYILNGKTYLGCDSIVTTTLKVNPVYRKTDTIAICKGDTLKIHGKRYTVAGTYRDSFKTTKGCDSLFTTRVTVNPTYNDSSRRSICSGDSSLIHGVWRKTAGFYRLNGKTIKGCDSFSTIQLIIKPVYNYSLNPEICSGDSIRIHGIMRKTAGTYVLNGKTYLGCDSIVTTMLKVNPVYRKTETIEICGGDTLRIHGKRYTVPGTYKDSFKTTKGCDSLFTTNLIVNTTYVLTQNRGLCGGDSFFFAGSWRRVTGQYVGNFTTVKGCDSTVTLNLTVDSIIRSDDFPQICLGDSMLIGGQWRKTAGIYTDVYRAFKGCDSVVTRHLGIIQRDTAYLTATICQRGSFSFHGQILTDTGTYKTILKNRRGCDSVLFIRILKREENRTIFSGTVCFGEGFFAGKSLKFGSGTFFDTLTDRFGCDSVVIYTQTERARDTTAVSFSICSGDSVFSGNSWKKSAGIYREILKNRFGCDSAVTTRISIRPTSFTTIRDTICFGSAYNFLGTTLTDPGIYRKVLVNHEGCDSVVELSLFRRAQFIPKVVSSGFATLTTDKPYKTYQWFADRIMLPGETSRSIKVSSNGIYDVSVTDTLGCGANSWDDLLSAGSAQFAEIRVFPNPSRGRFFVETNAKAEIFIWSSNGKSLLKQNVAAGRNELDIESYPEGIYQILIISGNVLYSGAVVIIH